LGETSAAVLRLVSRDLDRQMAAPAAAARRPAAVSAAE
jgi:hypothetical protein